MINLYIIYIFILFTLLLNVGNFLQYKKSFAKRERLYYVYLLISIFLWLLTYSLSDIVKVESYAVFFTRLTILFPLHALNAVAQLIREYPKVIGDTSKKYTFKISNILVFVFTAFALILLNSRANLKDYTIVSDGPIDFSPGWLYIILPFLSIYIILTIIIHWKRNFPLYTKTQKSQTISMLSVLLFVYLSLSIGLVVFPLKGLSIYSPFMFLSLSLLLFFLSKSLWARVVVFDIKEEISKIGSLIISTFFLILVTSYINFVKIELNFISQFLGAFLLISIIISIYNAFTNIYKREKHILEQKITKFIENSTKEIYVNEISTSFRHILQELLNPKKITLQIFKNNKTSFEKEFETWWRLRTITPLVNKEVLIESYFDKENNKEVTKKIFNHFQENNIDLLIPISNREELIGVAYITNIEKILNDSDYRALELLSNSVSVSISRALIYEEVEKLNNSLQQKVDYQTKELQLKVKQLQEARRKESDMIDIMGHELRTPATVIKLNVDFLQKFSEHLPKNKEDFLKYVSRIKDAIDTEIRLINTLLTSAKLEGDKIEINAEKVDFTKEIEMALHAEEHLAQDKGIKIVNNIPKDIPPVYADHARVSEIFNNLISNAVRYTDKGSVVVDAIEEKQYIKITITDTGKGISKKDIARLGTKFFRTKTYIKSQNGDNFNIVRPGGTGLGLYVSFGLAQKMGGRIEVKSEINKGSTFSVYLPKYRSQEGNNKEEGTKDMFTKLGLK